MKNVAERMQKMFFTCAVVQNNRIAITFSVAISVAISAAISVAISIAISVAISVAIFASLLVLDTFLCLGTEIDGQLRDVITAKAFITWIAKESKFS